MITEGEALQAAHPGVYINDFAPNDSVNVLSGMTQAGARDFVLNGTKLSVGFTSMAAEQYASVWDTLLSKRLVATVPDFSTQWFNDLQNGQILTVMAQAWAPSYIGSSLDKTLGDWRVAPLPQFVAGQNIGMNGGGSPEAVTSQTKYPKQAAEFDILAQHVQGVSQPAGQAAVGVVPDGDDGQRVRCVPQPEAAAHGEPGAVPGLRELRARPWVRFRLRPVCQLRRQRGRQCHGPGSPGARDREANVRFPAERVRFIREATRLYHCWFVTTRGVL